MSPKQGHFSLTSVVIALLFFASCDYGVAFEEYQSLPANGWPQEKALSFQTEMTDTLALHEMYLNVRNTTDYGYRNLYIFLDIEFPGGTILRDTIECILADREGKWTGSGFGAIKSNRFLFRNEVWFPEQGTYTFTMHQAMREESLQGISDIGIRIERK